MANVLVVDDTAFMRLSIKQILEKNGHKMIAEAADGKEAILKFSKWTLTNDLVGDSICGDASFKEYIYKRYEEEK